MPGRARRRGTLPAFAAYLLYAGGSALFFASYGTLANVYRIRVAHLDALQLVLVGTALEASVFLFEVPTGVLADSVSRRSSVLVGLALTGAGYVLEGAVPRFWPILLAQLVWGLGSTFESGAIDAWVTDEIGEARAAGAFMRAAQVGQVASLAGIGLAALLGRVGLAWPLLAGGAGFLLLGGTLALVMGETGFVPARAAGAARGEVAGAVAGGAAALRRTLAAGVRTARERPVVRWILLIALLAGAASEIFDRLWQARLLQHPLAFAAGLGTAGFFGAVAAAAMLLSLIATEIARRRVNGAEHRATARALMVLTSVLSLSVLGFGVAGDGRTALAFYFLAVVIRRVNAPLGRAWLNQSATAEVRATLFSFASQVDALGQIVGGPLLGVLALEAGLPWAFAGCAALLVPAVAIYARTLRLPPGVGPPPGGGAPSGVSPGSGAAPGGRPG